MIMVPELGTGRSNRSAWLFGPQVELTASILEAKIKQCSFYLQYTHCPQKWTSMYPDMGRL